MNFITAMREDHRLGVLLVRREFFIEIFGEEGDYAKRGNLREDFNVSEVKSFNVASSS